jgi:hypothetical protein
MEDDVLPYAWVHNYYSWDWLHPTRIWRKITNVVRWTPTLWNDVDWDYSSLYIMMEKKIAYMREHQIKHANHTDFEELADQMTKAEGCLRRIREDNYLEKEWDEHHEKYPRVPHDQWEKTADGGSVMPPMSEECSKDFKRLIKLEEGLMQEDYEEFAKIFKISRGWWD